MFSDFYVILIKGDIYRDSLQFLPDCFNVYINDAIKFSFLACDLCSNLESAAGKGNPIIILFE